MKIPSLKELREAQVFQVAREDEVKKVEEAFSSIRPEAADEILKQVVVKATEDSLSHALVPVLAPPAIARPSLKAGLWVSAVSGLAAVLAIGLSGPFSKLFSSSVKKSGESQVAYRPLSRAELNQRIAQAIAATHSSRVIYEDILGEGVGAWDPSPRYPHGIVNCILWVDQVLSEAYGAGLLDKTPVMDKIRYFKGEVAFGMRKHFVPHRLEVEPEPLKLVQLSRYTDHVSRKKVTLDFDHFAEAHQYTCPFYRRDQRSFVLNYVSPDTVLEVARVLPEGFYFLFAVPTDHYQKVYGAKSGPLGLVHGLILEVTANQQWIHHASTSAKRVMKQTIDEYVAEMRKRLHQGYVIYEADPAWNFTLASSPDSETLAIQQCEKNLHGMGSRRSAGLR